MFHLHFVLLQVQTAQVRRHPGYNKESKGLYPNPEAPKQVRRGRAQILEERVRLANGR